MNTILKESKLKLFTLFFAVSCTVIFNLTIIGCNKSKESNTKTNLDLNGALLFISDNGLLFKLDLHSQVIDTIVYNGFLERIGKISSTEFIVEDGLGIYRLNIKSKIKKFIRSGSRIFYLENQKKLFFYDTTDEAKVFGLYMFSLDSLSKSNLIIKAPKGFLDLFPPVQISDNYIICMGWDNNLWEYNITSSELVSTGISGKYNPEAWISKHKILLCRVYGGGSSRAYEINLENKNIAEIPILNDMTDAKYLDKYDAIIYSNYTLGFFGELSGSRSDLFYYSFKDNLNVELASYISMSSAVYLDE